MAKINKRKNNNRILAILIFLCIISSIKSDIVWIFYENGASSAEYKHINGQKTQTVACEFGGAIPYYMKVMVTPSDGEETPLLCFSPSDANCQSNRQALARRTDGKPAFLYLKKEQFSIGMNELFIYITCLENKCSYTLTFIGGQSAEITPNSVYSYLVTNDNQNMLFEVIKEGVIEDGSFLTIGIEGSSTAQLNIENIDKKIIYLNNGKIITFPIYDEDSKILSKFYVKGASVGDYLTVNIHIVYDCKAQDNLLYPNGQVIMGMLDSQDGYFREECFPISSLASDKYSFINKFYLSGKIHSKYALVWLADENDLYMEETEQEISDGLLSYVIMAEGKKRSVCFEFSYDSTIEIGHVEYSISLIEPINLGYLYNFYPPQIVGEIYRKIIPKGSYAVYHAGKIESIDKRYNFNIYNRKGVTEMYVTECNSFPNCIYNAEDFQMMIKPKRINRMTIWENTIESNIYALDSKKYVMIAFCSDDNNENEGYCEFDTSITTPSKEIPLVENEEYSKYVLKNEKGNFLIDLKGGKKIQRLTIDIMIYSGDISFKVQGFEDNYNLKLKAEEIEITYYKYYLANKIFYHFNLAQLIYDSFKIEYKAQLNSFFTIKYEINTYNLIRLEENIISGENYLVQIDPTTNQKYKIVNLENYRKKMKEPFLVNFFSINCDLQITRGDNKIDFFNGQAQEIIKNDNKGYNSDKYEYNITIIESDSSNYNHKMCMLYVSGYEFQDLYYQTEIVVGENVNQKILFYEDFQTIRFLYPQADLEKDLAVYFNVIDKAYYKIKIYANDLLFMEHLITKNKIIYISRIDILSICLDNNICSIIVEVSLSDKIDNNEYSMIEMTIRHIKNTPSYLQKNIVKKDFTYSDYLYYLYTDIGKNEIAEIYINFYRDFGNAWGRIVRKDQILIDEEANWRGIYRMPSPAWEDESMNGYIKKLKFDVESTQDCIEGCYLLLSIQASQIGDYIEDLAFPFTIITRISPNNYGYTDIPKIPIHINEIIIGNVDISINERIYQFYEVWLPHDSDKVEFDFQSEVAGLYINLGGVRPTIKNSDFKLLPPGRDSILTLYKFDILQKAKEKKIVIPNPNSLKDVNLVIGIWTNKTNSLNTELFSLRINQPSDDISLDIIEINSDQKNLCNPKYLKDNQFQCLFMITFEDEDIFEVPLLVHATSINQSAITHIYASFIERKYYDECDNDSLRKMIPTSETSQYSTNKTDREYIYTKLTHSVKNYLFVNVISDKPDNILLLTSMPLYNVMDSKNYEFYPNSFSEQLLSISKNNLNLKFFTYSSLVINIVSLEGEAEIAWGEDPSTIYYLKGKRDRLTLTSGELLDYLVITKIDKSNDKLKNEDPGFVFYISYFIREAENNFDEVKFGTSVEIGYRNTDLPVYLFSKIDNYYKDIIISATFKDSDIDTNGELSSSPLNVKAALIKENSIYKIKSNPELAPSLDKSIFGSYDPALKTAVVFLPSSIIKNFNIKIEDNPTLYLALEKNEKFVDKKYPKFSIEVQFTKLNGGDFPTENIYHYGKFNNYIDNYYRLRKDKNKQYMIIEISFNSDYLDFSINQAISKGNSTKIIKKAIKEKGKILLLVDTTIINSDIIYLNIFGEKLNSNNISTMLNNYIFKYININNEDEFIDYKILDNNSTLIFNEKKEGNIAIIECIFNKIDIDKEKANITYFLKVFDNKTYIQGEEYETIAFMMSPYYTVYERNPKDDDGKIILIAKVDFSNWIYLQVIAQIQQYDNLEYICYKGIKNERPSEHEKEEEKEDEKEDEKEEEKEKEKEEEKEKEKKEN